MARPGHKITDISSESPVDGVGSLFAGGGALARAAE